MSQRSLPLMAVVACLSSSVAPVWSQSPLPAEDHLNVVNALISDHDQTGRSDRRNVDERMSNLRPLSRHQSFVASVFGSEPLQA
jgi:hypothetical protein